MQKNNRVVIFCGALAAGGAERVISMLAGFFLQDFQHVEIVMYYDVPVWYRIDDRVKIVSLEKLIKSRNIIKKAFGFRRYIKNTTPDVVFSFLSPFNIFALISLFRCHAPVIVADRADPHFDPALSILRFLRNFLYRFASGVVVQTESNLSYYPPNIKAKSTVIFNPVFLQDYAGKALEVSSKRKIVSVGRLTSVKNQIMLIDAFALFCQKFNDYELFIYGEGDLRKILEEHIEKSGLQDKVKLPGAQKNVFDHIVDAKLFVMSSDNEGMPNALIEAMCLGLPCISTRVSGAIDLIEDGVNGCLINTGDKDSLVRNMIELVENTPKARKMAKEAVKLADRLKIDDIAGQWITYMHKVLKVHGK